ncbi:MAG: methyltransferase domain-containing protein [Ideonella sp.]|nr:methyltransferase domain-containing protein [Ideonella sp.]MCC7456061.1 methyltransferase domain-containing protein [Nitrospira sp.]
MSARDDAILELAAWLQSPPGRYLLAWEQARLDEMVADRFGFHALQLGLPQLDALRANRMPYRWVAHDSLVVPGRSELPRAAEPIASTDASGPSVALHCDFDALPFPNQSIDLLVLPHGLELARDPHETLREAERVLVPEGRVVIVGFNPASLWGLRRRLGALRQRMSSAQRPRFLPREGELIGYWRLRDWLRLLSFEVEHGRFGCWRAPVRSQAWLDRWAWIERTGERWWPVFGAVYLLVAVKRVRGMRLVGLARQKAKPQAAPAVATHHRRETAEVD